MGDEAEIGSAGTANRAGHAQGGGGQQSPLQSRAQFLKNRSWEFIISLNKAACERGGAQHGFNSETQATLAREWEKKKGLTLSLAETLDFLRSCHRGAPFLFFNGNTFADVGRQIATALFADLPTARRREAASAIAHYIAGVLDGEAMVSIVESLWESADFKRGDRVKTLRGSAHGTVLRVLKDGRIVWQPEGRHSELTALPESLIREK